MPLVPVRVQFGKRAFDHVVDTDKSASALRRDLEAETGIPAARQKVFARGAGGWQGNLADGTDLSGLRPGQVILISGSTAAAARKLNA
eukprot:CAMPEP_0118855212 /NCGR_PEP_ID=MMETSP1163-20130328/3126_1 /TAXON_ID=124430 /ORGANISM="Phaeomonas parva, Strain CCMP2877" /LENGTH=87 /DNA_ID=CAMNT_0006788063 /DNA_START=101 /DNA_END=361 /DNA_ORIENTATION=+